MTWDEDYYLGSSDYPYPESRELFEDDPFARMWQESEEVEESEHVDVLRLALEALTPKQRFVMEMYWGLRGEREHSFREIAELMGIRLQAVQDHHRYAMKKLERALVS